MTQVKNPKKVSIPMKKLDSSFIAHHTADGPDTLREVSNGSITHPVLFKQSRGLYFQFSSAELKYLQDMASQGQEVVISVLLRLPGRRSKICSFLTSQVDEIIEDTHMCNISDEKLSFKVLTGGACHRMPY